MYITSSSSLKTCKEIIDSLVECKFFNVEDYVWLIGVNHLNNIIEDYNNGPTYFPFTRKTDSTGKLFYIDYRLVPNNDTLKLVRKTDNLHPNFMVVSRGYGKSMTQFKYLEELMKKWNCEIINNNPSITNVIFNDPATIVFWDDGTKTVVKAENEPFDPEKGLAMAIAKKSLGNQSNYYNEFKKWLPEKKFTLPNSDSEKTKNKLCSKCKYADTPLFMMPCRHCFGHDRIDWEKADD